MKYALIADIHANLEGLEVVLEDAKKNNCTHYVCLGDVVGYNPNPVECMNIVREMEMPCIMGNHDEYCGGTTDLAGFNPHASHAIQWTRDQLSEEQRDWLRRLKYLRMIANFTIVHATLDGPKRWGYVLSKLDAASSFTYQNTGVCFFGHTHVPLAFVREQNSVTGGKYDKFTVEKGKKYFVNVGSVGQPRDGDPRAGYVIYDLEASTIELRRLDYDIEKTQAKILKAGLPERLANRLASGR